MKNYEIVDLLEETRRELKRDIDSHFDAKLEAFKCEFLREKIEGLGWIKIGFYAPGNECIYEKNDKKIAVYLDGSRVLLRNESQIKWIHDYEHLEDYANGVVYSDFKFWAYY